MNTGRGPAYDFWLQTQRALDLAEISLRELVERSGVSATTISRLRSAPARDRNKRRQIVQTLAATLNQAVREKGLPDERLPFPGDEDVLRLAGLLLPEPDGSVSVRVAVLSSTEYTAEQTDVLLRLLDVFDRANGRRRANTDAA